LGILQEAATEAACRLHASREEMLTKYHAFWMLARIWYRLERPLTWDESITIRTWHRGNHGAAMYRDYDIYSGEELVGESVSVWVLADQDTRRLLRLADMTEFSESDGGALCKQMRLPKLRIPISLEQAEDRPTWYSDADINGHVNNVRYADFTCDAIHLEQIEQGRFASELKLSYLKECRSGETLSLYTGMQDGTWYVHGAGCGGDARFDAALTLSAKKR
jgi:acyl-ACP thioesterase